MRPMPAWRSGSCRRIRSTATTPAASTATPIAQPSGANVSTMTRTTPGVLASTTPRRPPRSSARSSPPARSVTAPSLSADRARRGRGHAEVRSFRRHAGDAAPAAAHLLGERDGVVDRGTAGVVVEVDEDLVAVVGEDVLKGGGPAGELALGVERPRLALAFVKAQISPVGGPPQRRDRALAVGPAQRRIVGLEHPSYVVRPPRVVPRLDGEPHSLGKGAKGVVQSVNVHRQVG